MSVVPFRKKTTLKSVKTFLKHDAANVSFFFLQLEQKQNEIAGKKKSVLKFAKILLSIVGSFNAEADTFLELLHHKQGFQAVWSFNKLNYQQDRALHRRLSLLNYSFFPHDCYKAKFQFKTMLNSN